jgi:hypothetical protein
VVLTNLRTSNYAYFIASLACIAWLCLQYNSGVYLRWFLQENISRTILLDDIYPNIGLYWYFAVQVFPRFRNFFLVILQTQLYFVQIPLWLRFKYFASFPLQSSHPSSSDQSQRAIFILHLKSFRFSTPFRVLLIS